MLSEAGIVGPPNGSKPREVMISEEQYEAGKLRLVPFPLHDRAKSVAPSSYLGEDENEEIEEEEDEVLDFSRDENSSEELEDDDSSSDEEEQEDVEEEQERC